MGRSSQHILFLFFFPFPKCNYLFVKLQLKGSSLGKKMGGGVSPAERPLAGSGAGGGSGRLAGADEAIS